jgi:hypothetical protein
MTSSEWIDGLLRNTRSFARDAIQHPFAAAFSLGMLAFGFYVMALIAWLFVLIVASWFGFHTEDEIREERERVLFIRAHREAFCFRERIPSAYCDEIFRKSAAYNDAIHVWVQEKMAQDKRKQDAAPYFGLLAFFKLPTSRR